MQLLLMPQFGHLFIAGIILYQINTGRATLPACLALGLAILYSLFGRPDRAQIEPIPYFLINAVFIAAVWTASPGRDYSPFLRWLGSDYVLIPLYLLPV